MSEFQKQNRKEWIQLQEEVFGKITAETQQWRSLSDIVRVLEPFCGRNRNHMFLPDGGGMDLEAVASSHERDCLELRTGGAFYLVRPARLVFESFENYRSMSYFRLEAQTLAPSGVYAESPNDFEEVVELAPGQYEERSVWDEGHLGEDEHGLLIRLPDTARICMRYFTGSFVVFAKGSIYNRMSQTYDARHAKMNADGFRAYIEKMIVAAVEQNVAE